MGKKIIKDTGWIMVFDLRITRPDWVKPPQFENIEQARMYLASQNKEKTK